MEILNAKNNLERLTNELKANSVLFRYKFKSLSVQCIYFGSTQTMLLGLSDRNTAWSMDLSNSKISTFINRESYYHLKDLLIVNGELSNDLFFETLKVVLESLSIEDLSLPTNNTILESFKYATTKDRKYDPEGDNPFFGHWRRTKPTSASLKKIQNTFGRKVREACYQNKVTGVWYESPTEKSLDFLNPGRTLLEINKTNG